MMLSLLILAAGCARIEPASTATPALVDDPTVLVVVMDGARAQETLGDTISSATAEAPWEMMPTVWDELVPQGLRATSAWTLGSSITVPSHGALLTGRRSPPMANYPPSEEPGAYRSQLPVLAQVLLGADPTLAPADAPILANTELLEGLAGSQWPGLPELGSDGFVFVTDPVLDGGSHDDSDVLEALQQEMEGGTLRLAVANLHQLDRSGHNGKPDDYVDDIRRLDRPLVSFWRWVQDHPDYADRSYLLLMSDHGRHNSASSMPPWRHHGCSCSGCRNVPFLLLGPGVRAGDLVESPVLLTDVAPTLGALLEVELPWADGLVRDDLLADPTGFPSRQGLGDLAVASEHRAELRYDTDPGHRAELWVDGQVLSDPRALVVESPAIATQDDQVWVCWRELSLAGGDTQVRWKQRCSVSLDDGASWEPMPFAEGRGGPYGRPQLLPGDEGLAAAWINSPNGSTTGGSTDSDAEGSTVTVRMALHDGTEWTSGQAEAVPSFPTELSAVQDGDRYLLAMGAGNPDALTDVRHTRRVWLAEARLDGETWTIDDPTEVDLEILAPDDPYWRVEWPALTVAEDGRLLLAAVGNGSDGSSQAIFAASTDGGESFGKQRVLAVPGTLQPTTGPVWLVDRAVFATIDDDSLQLCAGDLDGVSCIDTGAPRAQALSVEGDTLHALVDTGVGHWEHRRWKASSFDAR